MAFISRHFYINTVFILLILGAGYYYRDRIEQFSYFVMAQYAPCKYPITYSIGEFDTKFAISEKDFKDTLAKAEKVWEGALGRELFEYDTEGKARSMKINLIYDDRQQATDKMKELGIVIGTDRKSYDKLKAQYDAMQSSYNTSKAALEKKVADYQARKEAYDKEVSYWNSRGGAPKAKYAELEAERKALNEEANLINQMQAALKEKVDSLNALGTEVNKLARSLNINVDTYNDTGGRGEEFSEGEYIKSGISQTINIYQFDSKTKLLRVLSHELGHSLGLEHVEDEKAIMYRLNQSTNEKASAADIAALKALCGVR